MSSEEGSTCCCKCITEIFSQLKALISHFCFPFAYQMHQDDEDSMESTSCVNEKEEISSNRIAYPEAESIRATHTKNYTTNSHCGDELRSVRSIVLKGPKYDPPKYLSHQEECVICLEEFDYQNPSIPTLCGCGENRALLHYPCLLLWEKHYGRSVCPTCGRTLFYNEV
jgi:hypothetical protein